MFHVAREELGGVAQIQIDRLNPVLSSPSVVVSVVVSSLRKLNVWHSTHAIDVVFSRSNSTSERVLSSHLISERERELLGVQPRPVDT